MAEIWTCTNAEYHADNTKIGSTMLKTVLHSPAEYHARYITGTLKQKTSKAQLLGCVVHSLVLEPERFTRDYWLRPDGIDGRTKAGRERLAKLVAESTGKTLVPIEIHEQAKAMANAVLASDVTHKLIEEATRERAVLWEEGGMTFKARADLFLDRQDMESDLILDLKTSDDPTPENWGRSGNYGPIGKYRYDLQGYHYCLGMYALTERPCTFGAIVVGTPEPHDVYLYDLSAWLIPGAAWREKAVEMLRQTEWSGWKRPEQNRIIPLSPQKWDYPEE